MLQEDYPDGPEYDWYEIVDIQIRKIVKFSESDTYLEDRSPLTPTHQAHINSISTDEEKK
jgi:hypothetical protein